MGDAKMIFVIELKKCMANASIFYIIMGKFCYWEKSCSVILFKVNKNSKVDFYHTILPLGLAIYLKIEDS